MGDGLNAPPLDGIRVLDLSRVLAGPYCTMMLADLGAEVIKVEQPEVGDETRGWGPPFAGADAAYYLAINRSKRSVTLDLKSAEGRDAALRLATRSDVVVHNFRPATIERLGLGYERMREVAPGIVFCAISGFGSDRKPSDRPGYDFVVQAESGLMQATGDEEPMKVGVAVVDVLTGMNAAVAILAALHRRHRTGDGENIEVALLDSGLAALINVAQGSLVTGQEPRRHGNAHPNIVPYETFRAADGWVAVAAPNDRLYVAMCEAIGRPELGEDPRFARNRDRVERRQELTAALAATFAERPAEEWVKELQAAGVPVGKIRGVLEALDAAAQAGRPATVTVEHPAVGELTLLAPAIQLQRASLRAPAPPPLLGEHTEAVLGELGQDQPGAS